MILLVNYIVMHDAKRKNTFMFRVKKKRKERPKEWKRTHKQPTSTNRKETKHRKQK